MTHRFELEGKNFSGGSGDLPQQYDVFVRRKVVDATRLDVIDHVPGSRKSWPFPVELKTCDIVSVSQLALDKVREHVCKEAREHVSQLALDKVREHV